MHVFLLLQAGEHTQSALLATYLLATDAWPSFVATVFQPEKACSSRVPVSKPVFQPCSSQRIRVAMLFSLLLACHRLVAIVGPGIKQRS